MTASGKTLDLARGYTRPSTEADLACSAPPPGAGTGEKAVRMVQVWRRASCWAGDS